MVSFHQLKVSEVKKETNDCVSIRFDVPTELVDEYRFIQGQYITLKLTVNGEELRRCYSICTGPGDNELRVAVKRVVDGRASNWLNDHLSMGDELEVMTPMGNFYTELKSTHTKHYVLFAGGSGITPMMSILKAVLVSEPESMISLFYGSLNESAVIFREEIEAIKSESSDRLTVHYILDKPAGQIDTLYMGIMTEEKIAELAGQFIDLQGDNEYFLCGPGGMKDNVLAYLTSKSIEKDRIHVEVFTSEPEPVQEDSASVEEVKEVESCELTIIMDGDEYNATMKKGDVILQSALDAGMDAPYSCRGGMCSTCRAKVMEGSAKMKVNSALTDGEVEQGFILTCQAYPTSSAITVDYDEAL